MEINVTTENARVPLTILHVNGKIDSATYQEFQAKADALIDAGARYLLVDLANVEFISSAGLRALHSIFNSLRSLETDSKLTNEQIKKGIADGTYKSPHLKLLNLSTETQTAFKLSGFDMFIETFTDRQAALASF